MPSPIRLILLLLTACLTSMAQPSPTPRRTNSPKTTTYSASGEWQKVVMKPTARLAPAISPATPPPVAAPSVAAPSVAAPSVAAPSVAAPSPAMLPAAKPDNVTRTEPAPAPVGTETATRPRPAPVTDPGFRPAFTGDFATNRNGWKAGVKGDYHFQIGLGRYNIRKLKDNTNQIAFSYVPLPAELNLNLADVFTIKVDMLADSGRIPSGGLVFGVRDSLNFNAFTLNNKGAISIIRVANGETFSDYMPGDFFAPGVPVDKNRNRLTIRRKGEALHFYINEQEVRSSPYPFKMLAGNSIGMITSASWTSFQKLSVTLGGSTSDLPSGTGAILAPSAAPVQPATPSANDPATGVLETPKRARLGVAPFVFSELFTENGNGWLVGKKNGYEFELMQGSYYIQKTRLGTAELANCSIDLPPSVDLNKASSFTITADMIVPAGIQPDGGLAIGVKDEANLCQFRIIGRTKVSIKSLRKGISFADYMPGKIQPANVAIDRDRNTLMIQKRQRKLHFYINGEEVAGSPYAFKPLPGNGIGFITASTTVKFQKLVVQVE